MIDKSILNKLQKKSEENANFLSSNPAFSGVRTIISDMYDENAHFIYELIQNSDDANAKKIYFILREDCFILLHDGRDFTVSDPDTHEQDRINGTLGDLNSILAIASSNKTFEGNKIGKFGCGFKSVFMYTDTPIILNKDLNIVLVNFVSFRECTSEEIDHYLSYIPIDIQSDYQTKIIIPFNKVDHNKCYEEVKNTLDSLSNPILFIENVDVVRINIAGKIVEYKKNVEDIDVTLNDNDDLIFSDIQVQYIQCISGKKNTNYWKLSRYTPELKKYSIMFETSESKLVCINNNYLYCYFQTRQPCKQKFLINCSFEMNPSRTNIKDTERNKVLQDRIIELAVDSFPILSHLNAYRDEILSFLPELITYKNIINKFQRIAENYNIIPCSDGTYTSIRHAVFLDENLNSIFTESDIREIFNDNSLKVVFTSSPVSKVKNSFFREIVKTVSNFAKCINPDFMQKKFKKEKSWIENLYQAIKKKKENEIFFNSPIFYTEKRKWLPISNGTTIYLNGNADSSYECINNQLLNYSTNMRNILAEWFEEYTPKVQLSVLIKNFIDKKITEDDFLLGLIEIVLNAGSDLLSSFITQLKLLCFIRTKAGTYGKPDYVFNELKDNFWAGIYTDNYIIDKRYYKKVIKNSGSISFKKGSLCFDEICDSLLINQDYKTKKEDLRCSPIIYDGWIIADYYKHVNPAGVNYGTYPQYENFMDNTIMGLHDLLQIVCKYRNGDKAYSINDAKDASVKIFKILCFFASRDDYELDDWFYSITSFGCLANQHDLRACSLLNIIDVFFDNNDNLMDFRRNHYSLSDFSNIYDISRIKEDELKKIAEFLCVDDDHSSIKINHDNLEKLYNHNQKSKENLETLMNTIADVISDNEELESILTDDVIASMTRDDIKEALSAILKHRSKPEPDESLEGDISGTHHNENDINPDDVIEIDSDDIEFNTRDANELIGDSYKDKETVLTVEYSNESSLSSEERIEVNKRIAIPQATDYLASKGFDLSNSSTSRNIMNDVVSPSGEKCTVCVKSSSRETVELASHEIEAMHLSGKNFFLLIVCRKQNTFNHSHIRFFSFDDLLKSNETYSISFRTKDYTDNNMAAFINAIKFLPGTTLKFVINDESLKYADNEINDSFENIDNLVKRVDSSYINTTKDDDGDF